jgi:hypothetical protein
MVGKGGGREEAEYEATVLFMYVHGVGGYRKSQQHAPQMCIGIQRNLKIGNLGTKGFFCP